MSKITVSQVTNQNLVEHFQVSIINEIYAEDSKGRRKFLTDLRTQYVKEFNKKATTKKYRETVGKTNLQTNINDFFVELDRAFPNYDVKIRETQPGLSIPELGLNIYCIVSPWASHQISMYSKVFNRKELEEEFGYYKIMKKDDDVKQGIMISRVSFDDIIEIITKAIDIHKAAK